MINTAVILIMLMSTLGPATAIAILGYGAMKSIARNPAASPNTITRSFENEFIGCFDIPPLMNGIDSFHFIPFI